MSVSASKYCIKVISFNLHCDTAEEVPQGFISKTRRLRPRAGCELPKVPWEKVADLTGAAPRKQP